MSKISFGKYQGAGNDFILIDDRTLFFDSSLVKSLCDRKFGIGADGLILLQNDSAADFRMRIFNSDGSEAESCGNGLRCLVRFIQDLGENKEQYSIATADRIVQAKTNGEKITIRMGPATDFKKLIIDGREVYSLNTGVPHAVMLVPDTRQVDIYRDGPFFRNHPEFQPTGANVNFASIDSDGLVYVRTFERGVEGETMACGTGASAVGAIISLLGRSSPIHIRFPGGDVSVSIEGGEIFLTGDATLVFEGIF